jgi:Transcriptional regulator, AbiEi antitoxin
MPIQASRRWSLRGNTSLSSSRDVTSLDCYYRCMPVDAEAWSRLHTLAAGQFGLFTAAQARRHGVARYELARRAATGELWRAHHGVYGFSFEGWAAQWLALRPDDDVERRRADPDCIISHDSAAVIRELGTIVARGLFLTGPRRINTRSAHVHTYRRDIGARGVDWDVVEGLPVATPGRIIADLARDDVDGAHQGTVIADVLNSGLLTLDEVGARLDPFAHRWDEPSGTSLALRFSAAAERPLHLPA